MWYTKQKHLQIFSLSSAMSRKNTCFRVLLLFFLLLPIINTISSADSSDLSYEMLPLIRVYKNGTVERLLGTEVVPASVDPKTGVRSEDINIPSFESHISARLFLPNNTNPSQKVPLLIYFHGGAFCIQSAFAPRYHYYLNSLVAEANIVALSVNYRLAPENPLPIGYEDSWNSLKWVFSSRCKEPWIKKYVDFRYVYLGGDSAGGNIAHNVAIQAGLDKSDGVAIAGLFLNCPHFWGKEPIGNETANAAGKALVESIWIHAYPNSTGFDDPLVNPGMDPKLAKLGGKRVLVYVAENDILKDRGFYYAKVLRKSKWSGVVKVVEVMGEEHIFNLKFPDRPKASLMLKQVAAFLKQGKEYSDI